MGGKCFIGAREATESWRGHVTRVDDVTVRDRTRAQAEEKNPLSSASDVKIGAQSVSIYVDPVVGTRSGAQTPSHQSCWILLGAVTPCKKPGLNIAADRRLFDGTEWEMIGEGVDYGPMSYTGGL